jgi:hypothetical protein
MVEVCDSICVVSVRIQMNGYPFLPLSLVEFSHVPVLACVCGHNVSRF